MSNKNNYRNGINAEEKVKNVLQRAGARVEQSPGSRGAADLQAKFGTKAWSVQVKSGANPPKNLTGTDLQRLNQSATKRGTTPVLATVDNKGNVKFTSTRSGRQLKP